MLRSVKTKATGPLFKTTPPPVDPIHKEAYRIVERHFMAVKGRTGCYRGPSPSSVRTMAAEAEAEYQASKQAMIDLVEAGLRARL